MATKQEKVRDINRILAMPRNKSNLKPKASLIKGNIQYSMEFKTNSGRVYRGRVDFSSILTQLHGEDIRYLKAKYGR